MILLPGWAAPITNYRYPTKPKTLSGRLPGGDSGRPPRPDQFVGSTVDLKANHSVFGNLIRFDTGTMELKLDNDWETKMKGGGIRLK